MKKLFALLLVSIMAFAAHAQEKVEVKKTTTPVQKVHNTVSKHKHYKGYKTKHKYASGAKHVKKVNTMTGEVKRKDKMD